MDVSARDPEDPRALLGLIAKERDADQRDRYRMVLLALQGQEKLAIARLLGVAKSTVELWVYRYRQGGLEAVRPRKAKGATPRLPKARYEEFKTRFTAGPLDKDGVCTLRGKDAVRILKEEFGVAYTLAGAYALLHRLELSCLTPRPRHEKSDPEAMQRFKEQAPLLFTPCVRAGPAPSSASSSRTRPALASRGR